MKKIAWFVTYPIQLKNEAWELSITEDMNYYCPVVVLDKVGGMQDEN